MTGSLRISGLALLSALFFSLHNLGARVLAPDVPVLQSGVLASLATLTLCWLDLRFRHRSISLRSALPRLVALRSVLLALALPAAFFGFSHLPQIEAYAIFFLEPLLVILLFMPLLKETIGPRRLGAMVVSFLGTLLVLGPTRSFPPWRWPCPSRWVSWHGWLFNSWSGRS